MNPLEYYSNRSLRFTDDETKELISLYQEKKTVNELADHFRKTPGQVLYHLKRNGHISQQEYVTHHMAYCSSDLYKEIVCSNRGREVSDEAKQKEKEERKQKREERRQDKIRPLVQQTIAQYTMASIEKESSSSDTILSLKEEVHVLKKEVTEMKKDLKEMLRLIHLIYDFESQE